MFCLGSHIQAQSASGLSASAMGKPRAQKAAPPAGGDGGPLTKVPKLRQAKLELGAGAKTVSSGSSVD
eukprot:14571886-Alexandrium_andersonii.AAC.1